MSVSGEKRTSEGKPLPAPIEYRAVVNDSVDTAPDFTEPVSVIVDRIRQAIVDAREARLYDVFKKGLEQHHLANFAYPIHKQLWAPYRTTPDWEQVLEVWRQAEPLSIYIHVPFCVSRCKFCDYAVVPGTNEMQREEYVEALIREIELYAPALEGKQLAGFDLGGGTPTMLSAEQIGRIVAAVEKHCDFRKGIIRSIETTPKIAAAGLDKLRKIRKLGFSRISMGVQAVKSHSIEQLRQVGNSAVVVEQAVKNIREAGFDNLNLDLMYGFKSQGEDTLKATLDFAISQHPEVITLYRTHFKDTDIESHQSAVSLEYVNKLYDSAYQHLKEKGYQATYGQNTFSRNNGELGLSSYLENRSMKGVSYLGMGMGAQSKTPEGIAYNQGQKDKTLDSYYSSIREGKLPLQDYYQLPVEEQIAKAFAISLYSGVIRLDDLGKSFGIDLRYHFREEIDFVLKSGLMMLEDGILKVTKKGFKCINGIIPLFYSRAAQDDLQAQQP